MKVFIPLLLVSSAAMAHAQWSTTHLPTEPTTYLHNPELRAGDFNGDGMQDVLIFSTINERISWLDASGGGTLVEHLVTLLPPAFLQVRTCFVSDVNSDGYLDVVTTHHEFSSETEILTWYENDGTGLNWTTHTLSNGYVLWDMKTTAMEDLDGDGDQELIMNMATLGIGNTAFLLYEATPTGFVLFGVIGNSPELTQPVFADFDGDGDLDVGGLERSGNTAAWVENTSTMGSLSFGATTHSIPMSDTMLGTDWDGDGAGDLILSDGDQILLAVNDGQGGFAAAVPMFVSGPGTGPDIGVLAHDVRDMDGDGDEDLLMYWSAEPFGTRYHSYLVNEGLGSFAARVEMRTYAGVQNASARVVTDFDSDGDLDLIETTQMSGLFPQLDWVRNDRTFGQDFTGCPGLVNSQGHLSHLRVTGSQTVAVNQTTLAASQLPVGEFTLFLVGDSGFTGSIPFGSQGRFCLSGAVGRFNRVGELRMANAGGDALFTMDLTDVPSPAGSITVTAGMTKVFQAWHRDLVGGASTSNFTNAVSLTFL